MDAIIPARARISIRLNTIIMLFFDKIQLNTVYTIQTHDMHGVRVGRPHTAVLIDAAPQAGLGQDVHLLTFRTDDGRTYQRYGAPLPARARQYFMAGTLHDRGVPDET